MINQSVGRIIAAAVSMLAAAFAPCAARTVNLDGTWDFRFDEGKTLEDVASPAFEATTKIVVPGCWNAMPRWYDKHGTGQYRRRFSLDTDVADAFLVVDGCGLRAKFWVDGREVGFDKLPWSRVEFSTGPLKAGEHEVTAAVDSVVDAKKVKMFYSHYDFFPYGGFYHGVWLETQKSPVELRRLIVRTRDYRTGRVEIEAQFAGSGAPEDFEAQVSFDGCAATPVKFAGRRAALEVPSFKTWSPDEPNLHFVAVSWAGRTVRQRFGVRQVGTAGGRITLNGKPIYLKGFGRHESHVGFGAATPVQTMYEDVTNVKEMGGNFIRGAHYPQCDQFLDVCDELGVMVWEESLGWQNGVKHFTDPEFCALQTEQTRLMARNSINHPCVVISGFLNEAQFGAQSGRKLVDELIGAIRAEDTGHLVAYACSLWAKDICNSNTDVIAYNAYPCWYTHNLVTGSNEEMRRNIKSCHEEIIRHFRKRYPDGRPIIVSESGVKADYGVHDPRGRTQFSEDFQAEYERTMLEVLFGMKDVAGIAIWQLADSRSWVRRHNAMINRAYGMNTGGVFDSYRRPKLASKAVREMFRRPGPLHDQGKK